MISHEDFARHYQGEFKGGAVHPINYHRGVSTEMTPMPIQEDKYNLSTSYVPHGHRVPEKPDGQFNESTEKVDETSYIQANELYMKLLNEGSRQSFREKQRLSEDLERQKRLLMEDLARNEQLRVEQIRRKHEMKSAVFWNSHDPHREDHVQRNKHPAVNYYWSETETGESSSAAFNNNALIHRYGSGGYHKKDSQEQGLRNATNFGSREIDRLNNVVSQPFRPTLCDQFLGSSSSVKDNGGDKFRYSHDGSNNPDRVDTGRSSLPVRRVPVRENTLGHEGASIANKDYVPRFNGSTELRIEEKSAFRIVGNNPMPNRPGSLEHHRKMLHLDYKNSYESSTSNENDLINCAHADEKQKSTRESSGKDSKELEIWSDSSVKDDLNGLDKKNNKCNDSEQLNRQGSIERQSVCNGDSLSQTEGTVHDTKGDSENVTQDSEEIENIKHSNNDDLNSDREYQSDNAIDERSADNDLGEDGMDDIRSSEEQEGLYVANDLVLDLGDDKSDQGEQCSHSDFICQEESSSSRRRQSPKGVAELKITNVQSLRDRHYLLNDCHHSPSKDNIYSDGYTSSVTSPLLVENIASNEAVQKRKRNEQSSSSSVNENDSNDNIINPSAKRRNRSRSHKKGDEKDRGPVDFLASQHRVAIDLPKHNWLVERLLSENKLPPDALKSPPPLNKEQVEGDKSNKDSIGKSQESAFKKEEDKDTETDIFNRTNEEKADMYTEDVCQNADSMIEESVTDASLSEPATTEERQQKSLLKTPTTLAMQAAGLQTPNSRDNQGGSKYDKEGNEHIFEKQETSAISPSELNQYSMSPSRYSNDSSFVGYKRSDSGIESEEELRINRTLIIGDTEESVANRDRTSEGIDEAHKTRSLGDNNNTEESLFIEHQNHNIEGKQPTKFSEKSVDQEISSADSRKRSVEMTSCSDATNSIAPPPKLRRCSKDANNTTNTNKDNVETISKRNSSIEVGALSERIKLDLRSEQDGLLKIELSNDMKQNGSTSLDYASISDIATRMVNAELRGKGDKLPPPPAFIGRSNQNEIKQKNIVFGSREIVVTQTLTRTVQSVVAGPTVSLGKQGLLRPSPRRTLEAGATPQPMQPPVSGNHLPRFFHHHHHHHVHQHHATCGHPRQGIEQGPCNMHWDANCPHHGLMSAPDAANIHGHSKNRVPAVEHGAIMKEKAIGLPSHLQHGRECQDERRLCPQGFAKDTGTDEDPRALKPGVNVPPRPLSSHPDYQHRTFSREHGHQVVSPSGVAAQYPSLLNSHGGGIVRPSIASMEDEVSYLRARRELELKREVIRKETSSVGNDFRGRRPFQESSRHEGDAIREIPLIREGVPLQLNRNKLENDTLHRAGMLRETSSIRTANSCVRESNPMRDSSALEDNSSLRDIASIRQAEAIREHAILQEKMLSYAHSERGRSSNDEYERLRAFKQMKEHELLMKASQGVGGIDSRVLTRQGIEPRPMVSHSSLPGGIHRIDDPNLQERILRFNQEREKLNIPARSSSDQVFKRDSEFAIERGNMPFKSYQNQGEWTDPKSHSVEMRIGHMHRDMLTDHQSLRGRHMLPDGAITYDKSLPRAEAQFAKFPSKDPYVKDSRRTPFSEASRDAIKHPSQYQSSHSAEERHHPKAEPLAHAIDLSKHPTLSKTLEQISKQASYPAANGLINLAMLARQGGNDPTNSYAERERNKAGKDMRQERRPSISPHFFSGKGPQSGDYLQDFTRNKKPGPPFFEQQQREKFEQSSIEKRTSGHQSTPPVTRYFSGELFKMLSEDRKSTMSTRRTEPKTIDSNQSFNQAPSTVNSSENPDKDPPVRLCKICSKDAQFLCSGCRGAWYCSHECQIKEWKEHSKTCRKS